MGSSSVEQTVRIGMAEGVARLALNRPHKANAYLDATLETLAEALDTIASDPTIRVVVLGSSSAGRFCAGADLDEMRGKGPGHALRLRALELFDRLAAMPQPTIAAVDGPAVGGGFELALACDLRLASQRAFFSLPEVGHGLLPAAGATVRLSRLVGESVARQLVLFGQTLDAQRALSCGLVAEVVDPAELDDTVQRWADRVLSGDALALDLAKRAINAAFSADGGREQVQAWQALLYDRRQMKP